MGWPHGGCSGGGVFDGGLCSPLLFVDVFFVQGTIVVQAAGLTMAVFLGLTLFTFQTKIDFSFLASLTAGRWGLRLRARVWVSVGETGPFSPPHSTKKLPGFRPGSRRAHRFELCVVRGRSFFFCAVLVQHASDLYGLWCTCVCCPPPFGILCACG